MGKKGGRNVILDKPVEGSESVGGGFMAGIKVGFFLKTLQIVKEPGRGPGISLWSESLVGCGTESLRVSQIR